MTTTRVEFEAKIPERPKNARTGSQFIELIRDIPFDPGPDRKREQAYMEEYLAGNVPGFMRRAVPVIMKHEELRAQIYVLPDYLCIGSDDDFVYTPMSGITFGNICRAWDCTPPTRKMVQAIYDEAEVKLPFDPMVPPKYPYDLSMMHTTRYVEHSRWCRNRFVYGGVRGQLTAGHKKDVIIDTQLEDVNWKKVGVFGGYMYEKPIHDIVEHWHEWSYKDYSHGARPVIEPMEVWTDGEVDLVTLTRVTAVLAGPRFRLLHGREKDVHDPVAKKYVRPFKYPFYPEFTP